MVKKLLRFARDNPVASAFGAKFLGFALFGVGWYHGVNYKLDEHDREIEYLKSEIKEIKIGQGLVESSVRSNK